MNLLAAIPYEPTQQEVSMLIVIAGVSGLLVFANLILGIWEKVKRKPSLTEELSKYALKTELAAVESRIVTEIRDLKNERKSDVSALYGKFDELRALVAKGFQDTQRDIGRIEGKIEQR